MPIILFAISLLLAGQSRPAEYAWEKFSTKTVTVTPLRWQYMKVPAFDENGELLRVEVTADAGVTIGLFPMLKDGRIDAREAATCAEVGIVEGETECELLETPAALVVLDARTPTSAGLNSLAGLLTYDGAAITSATKPTKVKIVMYKRVCKAWCP